MENLALQVGLVDNVHVDDAKGADARGGQVQRSRRPEPARAQQQDARVQQLLLALLSDLGQQQVTLVAVALLTRESARGDPLATLVLPLVEPAGHGDDVGVAEVLQGLGCEGRAHTAGAVDDDRRRTIGDMGLDLRLQVAPRKVDSAREGPLLVLVGLPHVEDDSAGTGDGLGCGSRVDLPNLRLRLFQEFTEAGHSS